MYQNLREFAQRTLYLNFNMKHMIAVICLRFLFSLLGCLYEVPSSQWDTQRHFNVYKTSIRRRPRRIDVL